jgi:hypothetical protein
MRHSQIPNTSVDIQFRSTFAVGPHRRSHRPPGTTEIFAAMKSRVVALVYPSKVCCTSAAVPTDDRQVQLASSLFWNPIMTF